MLLPFENFGERYTILKAPNNNREKSGSNAAVCVRTLMIWCQSVKRYFRHFANDFSNLWKRREMHRTLFCHRWSCQSSSSAWKFYQREGALFFPLPNSYSKTSLRTALNLIKRNFVVLLSWFRHSLFALKVLGQNHGLTLDFNVRPDEPPNAISSPEKQHGKFEKLSGCNKQSDPAARPSRQRNAWLGMVISSVD